MAVTNTVVYPSWAQIAQLARTYSNDTFTSLDGTIGGGLVLTNDSPMMPGYINTAVATVWRKLAINGTPTMIVDNYILSGLPPVNSPAGQAVPNPQIQQSLSYQGFFDGLVIHPEFVLPADVLAVTRVWETQTGSGLPFRDMGEPQQGLVSANQGNRLTSWEWRQQQLNFLGCLNYSDIRVRYEQAIPLLDVAPADFPNVLVPIVDSAQAIAYLVSAMYAEGRGGDAAGFEAKAQETIDDMITRDVRRAQSVNYSRPEYEEGCDGGGWGY